ncbi:hypothetical protein ACFLRH_03680, partial [Actinomycetota bacterium]
MRRLYNKVFRIGEAVAAEPEDLELVVGVGCLTWQPDGHPPVSRHLFVADVQIDFDESSGQLTVRVPDDSDGLRLELDMVDPERWPTRERKQRLEANVESIEGHVLDIEVCRP